MDKETKQVTVNPFKRLTKNIIEVNRTPIVQALINVNDPNLMWYTIFVIGYRLRSLRFVRGGETNEPYHRARSYYYSGCYSWNYLVFRLQMAR